MAAPYSQTSQPMIVKYVQQERNGIQSHNFTRHCIGYIVRGRKYIYYGDVRHLVDRGDVFYLGLGNHYTEDIPEAGRNFEQITFYYSSEQLSRILNQLNMNYQLNIQRDHSCSQCENQSHVIAPAWNTLRNFFGSINQYLKDDLFGQDDTAEIIKITELMYLILSQSGSCLKSKILGNTDLMKENFEQIVMQNIFRDVSVEELALQCNRSLTSFKKEFRKHFHEPPHKWFIRQRLMHSRLLLISTHKSVAEIGTECSFPNTSHFIKLFKKEYGLTPAQYRHHHEQGLSLPPSAAQREALDEGGDYLFAPREGSGPSRAGANSDDSQVEI